MNLKHPEVFLPDWFGCLPAMKTEGALPDGKDAAELSPVSAKPEAPQPSMSNPTIPDSIRLVGYALIVLLGIKLASALSWGAFTVPIQRLGLASTLTEAAPFLLLALGLIFAGGNASRRRQEVPVLVVLQRLLLPLVIGYALVAPLVITDAFRAYRGADEQVAVQLQQARQFRRQVVDAVKPTTSATELAQALRSFPQIRSAINPAQPLDSIKKSLFDSLDKAVATLESRQGDQLTGARVGLVQRTIVTALLTVMTAIFLQLIREQNLLRISQQNNPPHLHTYFSANLFEPRRAVVPIRPRPDVASQSSGGWIEKLFRPDPTRPRRPPKPPKPPKAQGSGPPSFWQKLWGGSPAMPRMVAPRKPPKPPAPPKRPRG
jgi:hypothetical protein